jgi:hypothetical protein
MMSYSYHKLVLGTLNKPIINMKVTRKYPSLYFHACTSQSNLSEEGGRREGRKEVRESYMTYLHVIVCLGAAFYSRQ